MEVSDDEVGIVEVYVKSCDREEHSRDSTEREGHEETKRPEGVGAHDEAATPNGSEPVEHFRTRWNRNRHCGDHERSAPEWIHTGGEHVVAPDNEADYTDTGHSEHHGLVSENRAPCACCEDFRNDSEGRNNDHVHFWMAEEPEQMLEQQTVPT